MQLENYSGAARNSFLQCFRCICLFVLETDDLLIERREEMKKFLDGLREPATGARILFVALFGTVAPFGLYFAGVRLLGASRSSIAAMAEPVFSAGIAFALLGERLEAPQVAGAVGVIGAVVVLERFRDSAASKP